MRWWFEEAEKSKVSFRVSLQWRSVQENLYRESHAPPRDPDDAKSELIHLRVHLFPTFELLVITPMTIGNSYQVETFSKLPPHRDRV